MIFFSDLAPNSVFPTSVFSCHLLLFTRITMPKQKRHSDTIEELSLDSLSYPAPKRIPKHRRPLVLSDSDSDTEETDSSSSSSSAHSSESDSDYSDADNDVAHAGDQDAEDDMNLDALVEYSNIRPQLTRPDKRRRHQGGGNNRRARRFAGSFGGFVVAPVRCNGREPITVSGNIAIQDVLASNPDLSHSVSTIALAAEMLAYPDQLPAELLLIGKRYPLIFEHAKIASECAKELCTNRFMAAHSRNSVRRAQSNAIVKATTTKSNGVRTQLAVSPDRKRKGRVFSKAK